MGDIKSDHARYKEIIRNKVRQNLRYYISNHDLMGRQGKDKVVIPIRGINLPHFRYNQRQSGGVGQGEGDEGDPISGDEAPGSGKGAGEGSGKHDLEIEMTLEELADVLGKELGLPYIKPRGARDIKEEKTVYNSIAREGPKSLRHFKRTYKQALKRQIATGTYDSEDPIIVPHKEDIRYRYPQIIPKPETNAVLIYMMDVSGSMGDNEKKLVRTASFWIDLWLRRNYQNLERRFIVHDTDAKEVDEHAFYHTKESGGTKISSAYQLCVDLIEKYYPSPHWNIYPFHFTDGENYTGDNLHSFKLLRDNILPVSNLFCYGQCADRGTYLKDLMKEFELKHFDSNEKIRLAKFTQSLEIVDLIKNFLNTGR